MTTQRITITLVALCVLIGGTTAGVASMPAAAPGIAALASGSQATPSGAATDGSAALDSRATHNPIAALGSPPAQASDCDLIDIDGNDSTVSVDLTSNTTTGEGSGVTVRSQCGANATTVDHDLIDIDGNNNTVTLVVQAEDSDIALGENESADGNGSGIALNCGDGTVADCDVIDIDGDNNSVALVVRGDDGRTVREFGADEETAYYQVDFVVGEPIENLRGPEGYYTPDRLIRFAHGSTDTPVMRLSEGEFIEADKLANCIDSNPITVENGTATTTFTVAEDCGPVTLTLASYEKVGPGWSPETEEEQEFVDAETHTFGPGTHTLSVDLPDEASAANTSESHETDT